MSLVLGIIAASLVAIGLVWLFPDATERWLRRLMLARKIIFGTGLFVLSLFLIATSASYLPFIGVAILVIIFVYLLLDPQNELADLNPL
jgi:hypothetical protein